MSNNYSYNDYFLGEERAKAKFVHYAEDKWFQPGVDDLIPEGLMDERFMEVFDADREFRASRSGPFSPRRDASCLKRT